LIEDFSYAHITPAALAKARAHLWQNGKFAGATPSRISPETRFHAAQLLGVMWHLLWLAKAPFAGNPLMFFLVNNTSLFLRCNACQIFKDSRYRDVV
jgi:hypothetical protein